MRWATADASRIDQISGHDWSLLTGVVTGAQATVLILVSMALEPIRHTGAQWLRSGQVSLGLALLASTLGAALWNRANPLMPLTKMGQMMLFETLFALFYGFLWEQRWPRPHEVLVFARVAASMLSFITAHHRRASVN